MLGRQIFDPFHTESEEHSRITGMGLLDMETWFAHDKTQTQTKGRFSSVGGMLSGLNGMEYEGYEIHQGTTESTQSVLVGNGNVYGTYIHGIFDSRGITDVILQAISQKKGIPFSGQSFPNIREYKKKQYDLLADVVRSEINMELIYRILNREEMI